MKKAKKTLIFLIIVLVVIVAALVAITVINAINNRQAEKDKEDAIINLGSIGEADRFTLDCGKNGEDVTFVREDETWYVDSMRGLTLDQNTVGHIAEEVSGLTAERRISIAEDISYYGLDDPSFRFSASDPEGHSISLLIGKSFDTIAGTKYYVMKPDGDEIYTVDSDLVKALDYGVFDMAKPDAFPVLDQTNIDSMTIKDGSGTEICFEKKEDPAGTEDEPYIWYLKTGAGLVPVSDVKINPNNAGETTAKGYIDNILKTFSRSFFYKTCDFDRTDEELRSQFGFDGLTVEIAYTNKNDEGETVNDKLTFAFGGDFTENDGADAYTYAKFPGSGQVNCMTTRRVVPFRNAAADLAEAVK